MSHESDHDNHLHGAHPQRKLPSRRAFLAGGFVGFSTLVLAACSSAVREAEGGSGGSGNGEQGGTLTVGSLSDLNPSSIFSQGLTSMTIGLLVFDTLVKLNLETLEPEPSVAESWEISEDGLNVTLTLREDVSFHSGRTLTSKDVEYTLTNLAKDSAGSQLQAAAAAISSVNTDDDNVAVLTLEHPLVNLFDLLAFALLTDSESETELLEGESFVGTGPFVFDSWQRGRESRWSRNPDYWGTGPALDEVVVRVVPDSSALLSSARAGQTDVLVGVSGTDARQFENDANFTVESEDVFDVAYYLGVNVEDPALSDKRIRQAIAYAVDRDRILDEVLGGVGIAGSTPWAPNSPAFNVNASDRYAKDLDKAQQLLDEAGGAPAVPLTLSYGTGLAPASTIAAIIENNLTTLGFTITVDPKEQASFSPFLNSGEHQLWINPHGFGHLNPATLATGAAPFKPEGNLSGFDSPEYATLVDQLWKQADSGSAEAQETYAAYSDLLLDEQFVINLAISTNTNIYAGDVVGVSWNAYKNLILNETTVK